MEINNFSFRSLALENDKKGINFSYEYRLLNDETYLVLDYLIKSKNKYLEEHFIVTLLSDVEFFDIIKILGKEEIIENINHENYIKIFLANGPRGYYNNEGFVGKTSFKNVFAIKAYSKKSNRYMFTYTLDHELQKLLLANLDNKESIPEEGLVLTRALSNLLKNSYYYLRFNFRKYEYKLENIDPYNYLFNDSEYFKT